MEMTTQPHRQLLRRLCALGRVAGWAMIGFGILDVGSVAYAYFGAHVIGTLDYLRGNLELLVDNFLMGLVVLGTVQFIRYVIEEDTEPRWLLRNAHIVLSLFALLLLMKGGLRMGPQWWITLERTYTDAPRNTVFMGIEAVASFLPLLTKVLCFLGLAAILRIVLPAMAESKTLA